MTEKRTPTPRVNANELEHRDLRELASTYKATLGRAERDRGRLRELVDRMFRNLNQQAMGSTVAASEWEWCRIQCREILREVAK